MHPPQRRRPGRPARMARSACVAAVLLLAAACATPQSPVIAAPADLVLGQDDLPDGFVPAALSVEELVEGNRAALDSSRAARYVPAECRPTADGELNAQLGRENAAVAAARRGTSTLVSLVTTVRRSVDSDLLASTGRCARTVTEVTSGNLNGARVTTVFTTLTAPKIADVLREGEQALLLRSEVRTALPDGGVRNQIGFAGYAVLDRPGSGPVTVQLSVSGPATRAAQPAVEATAPMTDAEFVALFTTAVERVTAPAR